jgi:hypothetical protein
MSFKNFLRPLTFSFLVFTYMYMVYPDTFLKCQCVLGFVVFSIFFIQHLSYGLLLLQNMMVFVLMDFGVNHAWYNQAFSLFHSSLHEMISLNSFFIKTIICTRNLAFALQDIHNWIIWFRSTCSSVLAKFFCSFDLRCALTLLSLSSDPCFQLPSA